MFWSRFDVDKHWVEDTIYRIYRRYDVGANLGRQKYLKRLCMNELNHYPELKEEIKTDEQLEYFIMQMALENVFYAYKA